MLQRGGSSAKSARWGGDREDDADDDDGNGVQGYSDEGWAISLFGVDRVR